MRLVVTALIACCLLGPAHVSRAQDFFRGKTIRLLVGSQVGASYDGYARILARHMPRHIPGRPVIVVQNMPGAEGLPAANNLYNVADRDGTTIGVLNRATVLASLIGNEQARFKSERFNWLGTAASFEDNAYLFVIRAALPYANVESLRTSAAPLNVGNSGSSLVTLLKSGLHLNIKLIEGYGRSELDFAFERGEVDGVGIAHANLVARHPNWIVNKVARPMIQFGRTERLSVFPDLPTAREVAQNPEDRGLIELAEASLLIAYPFALPPLVPPERIAVIRKAFIDTMRDPLYRADVIKGKLDYSPRDGQEIQATIASMAGMSPATIARYKEIIALSRSGG